MKVLVACEFSGIVRDAFIERGHDAISCDLLPTERSGPHYQCDVIKLMDVIHSKGRPLETFDLIVAHPPCTYLCNSGVRWLYKGGKAGPVFDDHRIAKMKDARAFFMAFFSMAPRVAIENPVPHGHAKLPPFTQSIQPWQFGDNFKKRTCLWLKNLPPLVPTSDLDGSTAKPEVHHASPGSDRSKNRSRTYPGIAAAMAEQWGSLK